MIARNSVQETEGIQVIDQSRKMLNLAVVHRKMTRYVFLNIELLLNDGVKEISEYDVQHFMYIYFFKRFKNTVFRADREKEGKYDCVIYESNRPITFYEIKTYYKRHEKLNKKYFDKDINKIRNILIKKRNTRGYIFISGRKSKFSEDVLSDFIFISPTLIDNDKRWLPYELEGGFKIRLRPSVKELNGISIIITWEVKL